MTKDRLAAATLGLVAFFLFPATGTPAKATAEFVWLSDLHFDPTANPGLVDALAAARVEEWPRILASGQPAAFSKFGEDTNWALLSSSLDAIKKTAIDPRFTVVTGDILVHHFREKFAGAATNHDEEAFERFARRTMQFLAAQLANIAPGKPVLLTLGNNDSDCGDYQLQPHGAFLKDGSASIAKLLGSVADEAASVEWSALGSYSVRHPAVKHYRVIALNSVYF